TSALDDAGISLSAGDLKQIFRTVSWRVETAPPVIAKTHKLGKATADPLHGLFEASLKGKAVIVEYEADPELRDFEQVSLLEPGRVDAFIAREVIPYVADAWIKSDSTKIGYEISFTQHFYKPKPLRTLDQISSDIRDAESAVEGLLDDLVKVSAP